MSGVLPVALLHRRQGVRKREKEKREKGIIQEGHRDIEQRHRKEKAEMKSKKLLAAALAAVLTLAGCGTTVLSAEETKELLTLSQKTMATVESMAAEMTMEMDMSMGEETAETTTVAKILTQQNPLRMQMNLSATLEDGTEAQNMQMYAEEEDGKLRTYVLAADTWYSQTMELGSLAQYNAEIPKQQKLKVH